MNPAYRYLEHKLRIGELTIAQWIAIALGVFGAGVWASQISPFGGWVTAFTASYIAMVPAALAFVLGATGMDVKYELRHFVRWHRTPGRFLPGPGPATDGYSLFTDITEGRRAARETPDLDYAQLWD
jgi:hypothetical protein